MPTKIYNPDEVTVTYGDDLIEGFADGEMIVVTENAPRITKVVGSTGEVAVSRHLDRSATIAFKLLQTSESNDTFDQQAELNRKGPGLPGIKPVFVRDRNGRALHEAEHAWPEEVPAASYDRTATTREWKIGVADLKNQIRGTGAR